MMLKELIEMLGEATPRMCLVPSVNVIELGLSHRGNRKLEIQVFTFEKDSCSNTEIESLFSIVIDDAERILSSRQVF